jgi:hypothetical protein
MIGMITGIASSPGPGKKKGGGDGFGFAGNIFQARERVSCFCTRKCRSGLRRKLWGVTTPLRLVSGIRNTCPSSRLASRFADKVTLFPFASALANKEICEHSDKDGPPLANRTLSLAYPKHPGTGLDKPAIFKDVCGRSGQYVLTLGRSGRQRSWARSASQSLLNARDAAVVSSASRKSLIFPFSATRRPA